MTFLEYFCWAIFLWVCFSRGSAQVDEVTRNKENES